MRESHAERANIIVRRSSSSSSDDIPGDSRFSMIEARAFCPVLLPCPTENRAFLFLSTSEEIISGDESCQPGRQEREHADYYCSIGEFILAEDMSDNIYDCVVPS